MDIGIQTFTVRKEAKRDVLMTFKTLKLMGVNHIELAYVALDEQTILAIQETGIKVSAIQATYSKLSKDFNHIVNFANQVGCHKVVVSVLPLRSILFGMNAIKHFSRQLNSLNQRYIAKGFQIGFHHHDFEFKQVNGKTKLDWILSHTDPTIGIVSDTYWTKKAGYDPIVILKKIGKRLLGVHLRDIQENHRKDTILGTGMIDFKNIMAFLKDQQVYQVIEQNSKNPLSDIHQSIQYLEKIKKQFSER